MLQQSWASAVQMGHDTLSMTLGMAALTYALVRAHLETIEAVMLAAALLLIVFML